MFRGSTSSSLISQSSSNIASTHYLRVELESTSSSFQEVKQVYGNHLNIFSEEDIYVLENFERTTKFKEGRNEVQLPFKEHAETLGDTWITAKK